MSFVSSISGAEMSNYEIYMDERITEHAQKRRWCAPKAQLTHHRMLRDGQGPLRVGLQSRTKQSKGHDSIPSTIIHASFLSPILDKPSSCPVAAAVAVSNAHRSHQRRVSTDFLAQRGCARTGREGLSNYQAGRMWDCGRMRQVKKKNGARIVLFPP